jgi:hypothetical protein
MAVTSTILPPGPFQVPFDILRLNGAHLDTLFLEIRHKRASFSDAATCTPRSVPFVSQVIFQF